MNKNLIHNLELKARRDKSKITYQLGRRCFVPNIPDIELSQYITGDRYMTTAQIKSLSRNATEYAPLVAACALNSWHNSGLKVSYDVLYDAYEYPFQWAEKLCGVMKIPDEYIYIPMLLFGFRENSYNFLMHVFTALWADEEIRKQPLSSTIFAESLRALRLLGYKTFYDTFNVGRY